jgi:hypothetical protein
MRILLVYFLLIAIIFQSANKTIVYLNYYFNKTYIIKNVCENRFDKIPICKGHCYIKKELQKTEKQENKYPEKKHKEVQLYFDIIEISTIIPKDIKVNLRKVFSTFNFFSSKKIVPLFKPPQF